MTRLFMLVGILATFLTSPLQAQVSSDTVAVSRETAIIFRFMPRKLMFYTSYKENEKAIKKLGDLMDEHKDEIVQGNAFISIQGFCSSFPTEKENIQAAKNRTNQVKSYFITRGWMKEEYWRTQNYARNYDSHGDAVAYIRMEYPEGYLSADRQVEPDTVSRACTEEEIRERACSDSMICAGNETVVCESTVCDSLVREQAGQENAAVVPAACEYRFTPWSVKTNLLYDAVLTPSFEIEYRISKRWSISLEGALASWSNDTRHKYYHLAFISPETRYWFYAPERRKGHYVGVFAGGGWYDLQNGGRGYRGEGIFAGVSYGYQFPVGKYFSFETGIGIGYLNTTYDEYLPVDDDYVYQQTSKINYIGPLKLKFAWVWHIGQFLEKRGGNA